MRNTAKDVVKIHCKDIERNFLVYDFSIVARLR